MDIIISQKVKLITLLSEKKNILQYVQSRKLITRDQYKTLKEVSDPETQITDLLDVITEEEGKCITFLDLLKKLGVHESIPELKKQISTVNTSALTPAPQSSGQSSGSSVNIHVADGSHLCTPIIIGSQVSGFSMNTNYALQQRTDEKPPRSYDRTLNNNPRITDDQDFLKRKYPELVKKVKNVDGLVDYLHFLGNEMAANVRALPTDQAKMRKVLEYTTSTTAAQLLVDALYKHTPDVMEDLTTA
ncbi:uncharacterized protein LOC132891367 [Neoarius graeffei]|uniref:uncharacterized protein LOC132891367 n=1 Tax=Neoarius graeffei TaxID=443677 RepID=UPI00298CF5B3|nr:uncharacterized protein LOC132891367 [Neoarius graeffei]